MGGARPRNEREGPDEAEEAEFVPPRSTKPSLSPYAIECDVSLYSQRALEELLRNPANEVKIFTVRQSFTKSFIHKSLQ